MKQHKTSDDLLYFVDIRAPSASSKDEEHEAA